MSQSLHLVAKTIPGYAPSEARSLPCSGVSGTAVSVSPYTSCSDHRSFFPLKVGSTKCASRAASFVCKASSGGHRRNPEFSRQNKQGFFRKGSRQNEERYSFDNLDESDLLTSKNGPASSSSSNSKFQSTAVPGPREKEIVELFRQVQVQLRERSAAKGNKKGNEGSQGKGKQSETVDSLLKLLRKHSVQQGKKRSTSVSGGEFLPDQPEHNEDKNTSFFNSNNKGRNDVVEHSAPSFSRPPSNFRRKSPVPRAKFQPVYSSEDTVNSMSHLDEESELKKFEMLPDAAQQPESEPELEPEEEPEPNLEASYAGGHVFDDIDNSDEDNDKQQEIEHEDLNSLKLAELRAIAKSRGVKGFSRMKKAELVELLSTESDD